MDRTPLEWAWDLDNRHFFIVYINQYERIPSFHIQQIFQTTNSSVLSGGSVDCWNTVGRVAVDEGCKITGYTVGMLTAFDEWNELIHGFFRWPLKSIP